MFDMLHQMVEIRAYCTYQCINVLHEVDELVFAIVEDIPHAGGAELEELDDGTKNVWKSFGYV